MPSRRRRVPPILRFAGRLCATLGAFAVIVFGSIAFAQRIEQNVTLARELARTQHDIRALRIRQTEQQREIGRLQQPEGAVPYIYRRLRMVKPGQTLIYLVPAPTPAQ